MQLAPLDWLVVAAYFAAVIGVGWWFGRSERTTDDFFLGGRRQHWLVVGLSIIATEVSAVTFIAVPADAYRGDWRYLQMYVGSFIGRVLIIALLLPAFYQARVTTIYEYLGRRFGRWTQTATAGLFIASRLIGSGLRLLIAGSAISVVFGWDRTAVIIGCAGIAVAYTFAGGIKAIIWTDALQALIFMAGALTAVVFLATNTPGGASGVMTAAAESDKLRVFNFAWNLNDPGVFWLLTLSATFTTMAALGADQDLTQRMLTCTDVKQARRSLWFNAFAGLPIVCTFLAIGTLLFVFLTAHPEFAPAGDQQTDVVFPHVIAQAVPTGLGLKGLLVVAILACAMSSLDSALGALSSSAVADFYRPMMGGRTDERTELRLARGLVLVFGVALAWIALAFAGQDGLLWEVFRWAGLVLGAMLGVFLLGVLTQNRGHDLVNVAVMLASVRVLMFIRDLRDDDGRGPAWPWWVVIGTGITFGVGVCFPRRRSATVADAPAATRADAQDR